MGKSTATHMLRLMGVPVHDSDAAVHRLYACGGQAVPVIGQHFPDAIQNQAVNRQALGKLVLGDPAAMKRLETLIHPLVKAESQAWLKRQRRRQAPCVVLDIPLLFETGRDQEMDEVWVVDCPPFLQAQRALRRPGMTPEKLQQILGRQVTRTTRLRHATHVFQTGNGKAALHRQLSATLRGL